MAQKRIVHYRGYTIRKRPPGEGWWVVELRKSFGTLPAAKNFIFKKTERDQKRDERKRRL